MFTGIIQAVGGVRAVQSLPTGLRLTIDPGPLFTQPAQQISPLAPGDSLCVAGVCLTIAQLNNQLLDFDVVAETLAKTTLSRLQQGGKVNLEPALRANSPLGGHFLQGHVDAVASVSSINPDPADYRLTITPPPELLDFVIPKGSIAIDGVSLTVAAVSPDSFSVALIPATLQATTLASLRPGHPVNLETDILSKTVVHHLRRRQQSKQSDITAQALRNAGFID